MKIKYILLLLLFILPIHCVISYNIPIVIMHGINSDASSMDYIVQLCKDYYPNKYILNVELGNGRETSIFEPMFKQVEMFNTIIKSKKELLNGFHLIGFSQGTLITRGYIELYNSPPVINYISIAGPQAGQYGTPFVNIQMIDDLLSKIDYLSFIQHFIAPGQYWKNPQLLDLYYKHSIYLAIINNERNYNITFYNHFTSLNKLILIYSTNDEIIKPTISGWFGFYDQHFNILLFNQTNLYQQNLFGLKTLYNQNKIIFYKTTFTHSNHINHIAKNFIINNIIPWLK